MVCLRIVYAETNRVEVNVIHKRHLPPTFTFTDLPHHRTCRSAYGGFVLVLSLLDSAYWTSSLLLYCRDTPYRLEKRVPLRTSDYYISKYTDCLVRQCTIRPFALTVTRSATSASADSSTFVVTILADCRGLAG